MLFGISVLFTNCMEDSMEIEKPKADKYSVSRIGSNEFVKNRTLTEKLASIGRGIRQTTGGDYARYDNVQFDLILNEATFIEAIDGSYHSYTFGIYNEDDNYNINNIVLSLTENGDYEADLVTYTLTQEERSLIDSGIEIDLLDKMTVEPFDIDQINTYGRGSTCTEFVEVDRFENCANGHNVSSCTWECCGHCYEYVYEWQSVPCDGGGSGSGSTGTTPGGTTGSPGTSGGTTSTSGGPKATALTNTDGSSVRNPCENMNELFIDYPEYRQKLVDLSTTVNEDHENAVGVFKDGTEFDQSGTALEPYVELQLNPISEYIAIAHTHYETDATTGQDTYSVFSPNDLQFYYQRLKDNNLDHRKFVAFLVTGKGTRYALTIKNKTKYLNFFKYVTTYKKWQSGLAATQEETDYINNTIVPIFDKYYDMEGDNPAPIKTDNTDNQEVLEAFLQFIDEADMGVNLFSIDETFTNYTQLNYDDSEEDNIKETPCG